jgi:hypothetical protein
MERRKALLPRRHELRPLGSAARGQSLCCVVIRSQCSLIVTDLQEFHTIIVGEDLKELKTYISALQFIKTLHMNCCYRFTFLFDEDLQGFHAYVFGCRFTRKKNPRLNLCCRFTILFDKNLQELAIHLFFVAD